MIKGIILNSSEYILVIDDDEAMSKTIAHLLQGDYAVHTAISGEEGLKLADILRPQLILLDMNLPRISGIQVLKKLRRAGQNIPVMVITAYGKVETAVEAMKLGAMDFIEKPFLPDKLKEDIRKFLCLRNSSRAEPLMRQLIVGESPQIKAIWSLIEKFAPPDVTIILEGESGTGKELFAQAIHEMSKRNKGPFVPVDASVFPESLAESEVFGYEKGAFTGATERKAGRLEWANGGTLFLDEVSNIPLPIQAKLLRVIQEMKFSPLGAKASKSVNLDLRIIAATNRNLGEMVLSGKFREDLFYRLSVVTIQLPPLREREGDVSLLARHFLKIYGEKFGKTQLCLSSEAIELLEHHTWPGNIRELENVIKHAILIGDDLILPCHLPTRFISPEVLEPAHKDHVMKTDPDVAVDFQMGNMLDLKQFRARIADEAERELITKLDQGLNLKRVKQAELLNIDPKTLRAKLKKFGLEKH